MNSSITKDIDTSKRKKIAVYYYAFMGGGAEAVCLWILEGLKKEYDLTLFTFSDVDFEKLNSMYGTNLSNEYVTVKSLMPNILSSLSNFAIANNKALRKLFIHLLIRYFKSKQSDYDLMLSAYNAMDLGCKGIQYIHWVNVVEGNAFHHKISDFSEERLKSNISVANSYLVADAVKSQYGSDSTVVYPPVVIELPDTSWEQKENAFICSGRLTEAKQPHKIIEILSEVRKKGFDIKLYLTGGGGGSSAWQYKSFVKQMVAENSEWVTLYENLKYKDYIDVLAKCKYGIHFKQEPFGISIAEMMKAGAIPFLRSKGGQVEIVGEHNQEILFDDEEDAVEKIVKVISDPEKQKKILVSLEERRRLFSTDKFIAEFNKVVSKYFETN
ncbi:MAG: glycosyltransferase family 4 protein [Prochloraceae cyanobacterium]|nr:glycosyltransferase family 4 protein [Prochloraceae cyanobacterium]